MSVLLSLNREPPPGAYPCRASRWDRVSGLSVCGVGLGNSDPPLLSTPIPPGSAQTHNRRPRFRRTRCDTRGGSRVPWGSEGWPWPKETELSLSENGPFEAEIGVGALSRVPREKAGLERRHGEGGEAEDGLGRDSEGGVRGRGLRRGASSLGGVGAGPPTGLEPCPS